MTSLTTIDLDEAHSYIDDVFTPHRLVVSDASPLGFNLRYSDSPQLTVGRLRYGARLMVDVPPPESCYHLALPITGGCSVSQSGERADVEVGKRAAMLSPDDQLAVWWEPDAVEYIVKVPRSSLEVQLARMTGRPVIEPIRFDLGFALDTPGGQALAAAVEFLWTQLEHPGGIAAMPLAREHLEYVVLSQLLTVIPHSYSEALTEVGPPVRRRRVQQVVDFINAHPDACVTGAELAAHAGVTERALQIAFQRELAVTPTAYIRQVRLDRVHDALLCATAGTTVTDIASRWGFLHPSRFAQQYRERFGMLPSETMARARAEMR